MNEELDKYSSVPPLCARFLPSLNADSSPIIIMSAGAAAFTVTVRVRVTMLEDNKGGSKYVIVL